ncbi:hypothetical protein LPTSP4_20340 [Leptospira ryugenii]|uniref:Uncharacterized protein n=1 Tax=Leptospira ryugenii TaxID=1917863 RepID=A0A2P2E0U9_9LEPT|nr:hypothetical protein [Leptospira ryugenii]GBF50508.1 hypothetical protein LPTSP4_20340 [Leptospira ryugenii]
MELFSLVLINLLCLGVTYVFISAKVQKAVSEYYDQKLNRAIDLATSETIRELDRTVGIIESRLAALRAMLEKVESMGQNLQNGINNPQTSFSKQSIDEVPPYLEMGLSMDQEMKESKKEEEPIPEVLIKEQRNGIASVYQSNQQILQDLEKQTTDGAVTQAFSKLGKVVKGMMGMESDLQPSLEAVQNVNVPQFRPKMDFTVTGDPFSEEKSKSIIIRDETTEGNIRREFLTSLSAAADPAFAIYQNQMEDNIQLSLQAVLKDLPESATKIDKVIFLIKKGYSDEQISEFMNIGIHEIKLIKTIRLDRSRRV